MSELVANSEDPDQMPHFVVSDLGLHCLPVTLLVSPDQSGSSVQDAVDLSSVSVHPENTFSQCTA